MVAAKAGVRGRRIPAAKEQSSHNRADECATDRGCDLNCRAAQVLILAIVLVRSSVLVNAVIAAEVKTDRACGAKQFNALAGVVSAIPGHGSSMAMVLY
jgi:hypothetical protein